MNFQDQLRVVLEMEEEETVGGAFGGTRPASHTSYSIARVRDWIISEASAGRGTRVLDALRSAWSTFQGRLLPMIIGSLVRFSFLIELTNLKVGSTKMKTRWLPGYILMPQEGSFEPIQGCFEPGNDPRAASFRDCVEVFTTAITLLADKLAMDASLGSELEELRTYHRVPYEFPLSYVDPHLVPVHAACNVQWAFTEDLRWLLKARRILRHAGPSVASVLRRIEKKKLEVKVFKTDRSLTGKDKTNRAKRWEVLADDFQHATIGECWSAERKLTRDLVSFHDFPRTLKAEFVRGGLLPEDSPPTRCPVTLELLSFRTLATSVTASTHGVSEYQVGHLHPLKREGRHVGENICWQSANGNRIQGDLTIEETEALLDQIADRRQRMSGSAQEAS